MAATDATKTLLQSVQFIKGIGDRRAELLQKVGVVSLNDLMTYYPRRYLNRALINKIADLRLGGEVTAIGRVVSFHFVPGRKSRFSLVLKDETGELKCTWFHGAYYMKNAFKIGEWLAVHGKVRFYNGLQMAHPEYDHLSEGDDNLWQSPNQRTIVPVYPGNADLDNAGLDSRGFRRLLWRVLLDFSAAIEENLPDELLTKYKFISRRAALNSIHFPDSEGQLQAAVRRLKFEELFYLELMMALRRAQQKKDQKGISFTKVGDRTGQLLQQLPFQLTEAQKKALREIWADMKSPSPMNRLLQGDVGSGKTIVALTALLLAVENGYQTALMAPTEILAEQHYLTFHRFLTDLGVSVVLLVGGQNKLERDQILDGIATGAIQTVIGTHALIQTGIQFHKLGLVVVDEQHRFGVMQRADLRLKGQNPDVLVMTATPIPRTLALTVYGDLDVSVIDEKPENRKPIQTVWRDVKKRDEIYQFVRQQVEGGKQAYIVFPLVEESEKMDLEAATENYEKLSAGIFKGLKVGLLHGRMKGEDKDQIMRAFAAGECQILVSTTVIEVGIDVANATVMIIEHGERFGLTQLHQLRGRVGRSSEKSFCILIAYPPLSQLARQRLQTMAKTNDGFEIAEVDLKLRGAGEFFGVRQHGQLRLKIADIIDDLPILNAARREAFELVAQDPTLTAIKFRAVRDFFNQYYRNRFQLGQVA